MLWKLKKNVRRTFSRFIFCDCNLISESNCDIVEDREKQKQWARILIGSSNFKLTNDTNYWGYYNFPDFLKIPFRQIRSA